MKHCILVGLLLAAGASPTLCPAEEKPPAPRPPPVVSPEVKADGSVIFRLKADQAKEVLVRGQWAKDPLPLTRDDKGVWSGACAPIAAGIWEYSLVVDGLAMVDPGNAAVKPMREPRTSILQVPASPGTPAQAWDFQDVPHGTVHTHVYLSKALGVPRELVIYTPPGYGAADAPYPLLVLQHGSGDNQQTWTVHGRAHLILDNLIAAGRAKPMVVVMLNGHAPMAKRSDNPAERWAQSLATFQRELLEDALPLAEQGYRVARDPAHRAIAGLSMGGGQALGVGLVQGGQFGWIGAFSAGVPPPEALAPALADAQAVNARLRLLWIAIGKNDVLLERHRTFIALLTQKGIAHEFLLTEGDHSWPVWRQYLIDFAPRLFQDRP